MRRFLTYGLFAGIAIAAAAPAQAQSRNESSGLLSTHLPDLMDPKGGTVLVKLVPVLSAPPSARGHAVFNYLKTQDAYVVQVNVRGLLSQSWYQIHLTRASVREQQNLGTFRTDTHGNGRAHLVVGSIPSFNIVNIRRPDVSGSRVLSSSMEAGGSLGKTPSRRVR